MENTTILVQTDAQVAADVETVTGLTDTLVEYSPLGFVLLLLGIGAVFVKKKMNK